MLQANWPFILICGLLFNFINTRPQSSFLKLGTAGILDRLLLCCGDASVQYMMFSALFASVQPSPNTTKKVLRSCQMSHGGWGTTSSLIENHCFKWTNSIYDFINQIWQEFKKTDLLYPSFTLPLPLYLFFPSSLPLLIFLSLSLPLSLQSRGKVVQCCWYDDSKSVGDPVLFFGFIKLRSFPLATLAKMIDHHDFHVHLLANRKRKLWSEGVLSF